MILLIGGSSHVGKTLIAQKLMTKHHIPYISLDHLKMAFIRSKMTDIKPENDVEMRYFMWPFVSEMMKTVIANKQSLIIEGCYIPAEWKSSFSKEELKEICSVFIVMKESYIRKNEAKIIHYADVMEQRHEECLDFERLIHCSQGFKLDAIEQNIPYLEISDDFVIEEIVEKVEALLRLK